MISDILFQPEYGFFRSALLLAALSSVVFGLIGTLVVVRRIGYLAGAISHCAFGGIGIGLWFKEVVATGALGFGLFTAKFASAPQQGNAAWREAADRFDPVWGAILAAVGAAIFLGTVGRRAREREDALIGILWSLGMAIGLLFLDRTRGYVSISGWLFGDIMLIASRDIGTVAILGGLICVIVASCFRRLEAVCFDEEFAQLRGVPVADYFLLLLVLVALTVVLMIRIVGMVLVIALLTIPAATAGRLTRRLGPMIFLAIFFCFAGSWTGLFLSLVLNFSAGPMIIVVVSAFYFLAVACTRRRE